MIREKKVITLKDFFDKSIDELINGQEDYQEYVIDFYNDTSLHALALNYKKEKKLWAKMGSVIVPINFYATYEKLKSVCSDIIDNNAKYCCKCGKKIEGPSENYFSGYYHKECFTLCVMNTDIFF